MDLGQAIHHIRKQSNYSQKEFSELLQIDQSYLSLIENNKKRPSTKLLERISVSTNIPFPILLFFSLTEDDVKPEKKELYHVLFPRIKEMIGDIFEATEVEKNDR